MGGARTDAIVVGGGPNGLAAGIALAREGRSVVVLERASRIGGGTRSAELTLPGFVHDVCSAVHPLAVGSPFFRQLPLDTYGLEWIQPTPLAHPFDDGTAVVLERSLDVTCESLGRDGDEYRSLVEPFVTMADDLLLQLLGPVLRPPRIPLTMARFGLAGLLRSASGLARQRFREERTRALFAGLAAHSVLPLKQRPSAAVALVFAVAGHAYGWPLPRGGSQCIADALAAHFRVLGGEIVTDYDVSAVGELPPAAAILLDVTPRQVVRLAGDALPPLYKRRLARYRYGPAAFKLDLALDGPIPWRAEACQRSGTVHLGGTLAEIAGAEQEVALGRHPERPFVLLAQPSLFDSTRAPAGKHTVWAYCHVPNGSTIDMTDRIEAQIERFAPGFRERVAARHAMSPAELERRNPNYVGGDITGGVQDMRQLFARPVARIDPYSTPNRRIYLCSSSTPPGGGVHGMCGYHASRSALRRALS
jgi:phytoene dehydrogenase-like protein